MRVLMGLAIWCATAFAAVGQSAGPHERAWARWIAEHVGIVERLGQTCPNLIVNRPRIAALRAHYFGRDHAEDFRRMLAELAAKPPLPCADGLGSYGRGGLLIRDLLVEAGTPSGSEKLVPGVDVAVQGMTQGPFEFFQLRTARFNAIAAALEEVCRGYKSVPALDMAVALAFQSDADRRTALHAAPGFIGELSARFDLKGDNPGFCRRALAEYGPDGPMPLLRRAIPAR